MPTVNEQIFDVGVRHQIQLERYKTGLVMEISDLLSRADADLVDKIASHKGDPSSWGQQRRRAVLDSVRSANKETFKRLDKKLTAEMLDLAETEVKFSAAALRKYVPIDLDMTMPSRHLLEAAVKSRPFQGKILGDWIQELGETKYKRIRDAINIGLVEGETIDQMVKRIRGTRANGFKDGILEINRRNAQAVVRTAVTHTTTQSRELLYAENDDLIKGVEWLSTLDGRTTDICRARDGKVFKPGEGPRPPAHVNCRSTTVPITKSWKELGVDLDEAPAGTRASMDGQVPADMNYSDWLKRQPQSVVEDVLGKSKAKLFTDGQLPLDRFVDEGGKPLTLADLKNTEGQAWRQAFADKEPKVATPGPQQITAADFGNLMAPSTVGAGLADSLAATWNAHVGMTPRQFADRLQGTLPSTSQATFAISAEKKPNAFSWLMNGYAADGSLDYRIQRSVDFADGVVHHGYFKLAKSKQGQGTARKLMRESIGMYQSWGIKEVITEAGLDAGGYTWARFGFIPSQADWDHLRSNNPGQLQRRLKVMLQENGITQTTFDAVTKLLNDPDPRTLWDVADLSARVGNGTLGSVLLSGTSWFGKLSLTEPETIRRFTDYVAKAPK